MCVRRRVFARVSILSASGPYLDRPADFPRPQPPVTQTIIVTPLYGIFEFVSLAVRFRGASRRKGRFFRAHCTRSNTTTTITTRARERETDKGRRIRSSLWIYFVLVHSSEAVAASTYRYVSVYRLCSILCVYIYIYFSELAFLLFIRGMARFVSGWQSASDGRAANRWE